MRKWIETILNTLAKIGHFDTYGESFANNSKVESIKISKDSIFIDFKTDVCIKVYKMPKSNTINVYETGNEEFPRTYENLVLSEPDNESFKLATQIYRRYDLFESFHGISDINEDEEIEEDEEESLFANNELPDEIQEEEDLRNKEEELRAELNMATLRCSDLKQTLQNTKSYYDAYRGGAMDNLNVSRNVVGGGGTTINKAMKTGIASNNNRGLGPIANTIDSEEEEDEEDQYDVEEEEYECEVSSTLCVYILDSSGL